MQRKTGMKLKTAMISGLLISFLASCGSSLPGDFCDIYEPVSMSDATARIVVQDDRRAAVSIAANETYRNRFCRG
jgi:hypothetical protein